MILVLSILLGLSVIANVVLYLAFRNIKRYSEDLEVTLIRGVLKDTSKLKEQSDSALDSLNRELGKFTTRKLR